MRTPLLIAAMTAVTAMAQNHTMFVHSGGDIDVILFAEIDSIRYSNISIDSVECQQPVVQEIWTPGYVYRYDIAEIDSVTFQSPAPIASPGSINLADGLGQYVTAYDDTDGIRLTLSDFTPSSMIPREGDVLYQLHSSGQLPAGFCCKVSTVEGSMLVCDAVEPVKVFSQLAEVSEQAQAVNALVSENEYPDLLSGAIHMTDELRDIPAGPEQAQIKGRISVKPNIRCYAGNFVYTRPDGEKVMKRRLFSEVRADVEATINGRRSIDKEQTVKKSLKLPLDMPLGLGQNAVLSFAGTLKVNGKMGLDYSYAARYRSTASTLVVYQPWGDYVDVVQYVSNHPLSVTEQNLEASMDGKVSMSGSLTLTLSQSGDSLKSISNVFTYGSSLDGEALFLKSEMPSAADDNALYQRITRTGVTAKPTESVVSTVKYQASTVKRSARLAPADTVVFYAVPKLSNPAYDRSGGTIRYDMEGTPMKFSRSRLGAAVEHNDGTFTRYGSSHIWPDNAREEFSVKVDYRPSKDLIYPTVTLSEGDAILASPAWPTVSNMIYPVTAVLEGDGVYVNSGASMMGSAVSGNHGIYVGNMFPIGKPVE